MQKAKNILFLCRPESKSRIVMEHLLQNQTAGINTIVLDNIEEINNLPLRE